jgi:hypothetical protein
MKPHAGPSSVSSAICVFSAVLSLFGNLQGNLAGGIASRLQFAVSGDWQGMDSCL